MRLIMSALLFVFANTSVHANDLQVIDGIEATRFDIPPVLHQLLKNPKITDFAYATPNTVLFVENQKLAALNLGKRNVGAKIPLPESTQRISVAMASGASLNTVYTYGKKSGKDAVFAYQGGGKFKKILETPQTITGLSAHKNRLFFAMGSSLFELHPGAKPQLLFASDIVRNISSIALDPELDILYFSSDQGVYALRAGTADLLIRGYNGRLEISHHDLLIENPSEQSWVRLSKLQELLQKSK